MLNIVNTTVIGWCVFCFSLHIFWAFISIRIIPRFSSISKINRKEWYNRGVSLIHAITMFSRTSYYWVFLNSDKKIMESTHHEIVTIDIMMGYLLYDLIYESLFCQQRDVLAHHLLGLVSHISTRLSNNNAAIFYTMMIYIAEGSTPFLHLSWLINQLSLTKTTIFKFCALILLLSFFLFRIALGPVVIWHMYKFKNEWNNNNLYYGNYLIIIMFVTLNYYWFRKLIQVAFKSTSANDKSKKK